MNATWKESMKYNQIPESEWEPFYKWYCETYPDGLMMISNAYFEWKN